MTALWCAALLILLPAAAQDETPAVQRYLAHLYLGDTVEDVQRIYPPAQEWPSHIESRGRVTRYQVQREYAKSFPQEVQTFWLGFKHGHLVEIQVIYTERYSRKKSGEMLAQDLALIYGDPRRSGDKYWWSDGKTVLRAFNAELPGPKEGAVELRTSIQVFDAGLYLRTD